VQEKSQIGINSLIVAVIKICSEKDGITYHKYLCSNSVPVVSGGTVSAS
jgi:hypothetical protein